MNESRCDERLKARVERVTDGFQVYFLKFICSRRTMNLFFFAEARTEALTAF
jgi:hypothetical protein